MLLIVCRLKSMSNGNIGGQQFETPMSAVHIPQAPSTRRDSNMRDRPLVCSADETLVAETKTKLSGRCAEWLKLDRESDRLSELWAALEGEAVARFDYFHMDEQERLGLPMGQEMAAIRRQLDALSLRRKRLYRAITALTPADIHEAVALLVMAARINERDKSPTAPLIRKVMEALAEQTCPECARAYAPSN